MSPEESIKQTGCAHPTLAAVDTRPRRNFSPHGPAGARRCALCSAVFTAEEVAELEKHRREVILPKQIAEQKAIGEAAFKMEAATKKK